MSDDAPKLHAEIEAARAEIVELRAAVVAMCDTYSANRAEKQKVKAYRLIAAKADAFSKEAVDSALERIERQDRDELERCRAVLQEIADSSTDPGAVELARKTLRAARPA